jgi:hypothetical protein
MRTSGTSSKWRDSLNKRRAGDGGENRRPSDATSDVGPPLYPSSRTTSKPSDGPRVHHDTIEVPEILSPPAPEENTPAVNTSRGVGNNKSLGSILLEAAFFLIVGDSLNEADPPEQQLRKFHMLNIGVSTLVSAIPSLILEGIEMYEPAALVMMLSTIVIAVSGMTSFLVMRRRKVVTDAHIVISAYSVMVLPTILGEIGLPGRCSVITVMLAMPYMTTLMFPHTWIIGAYVTVFVFIDYYNSYAMATRGVVLGLEQSRAYEPLQYYIMVSNALCAASSLVFVYGLQSIQRRIATHREKEEAFITNTVEGLQRLDASKATLAAADDEHLSEWTVGVITGCAAVIGRYRPHVPHYVLDAGATMAYAAPTESQATASVGPCGDERSARSSRHHRRKDHGRAMSRSFDAGSFQPNGAHADTTSQRSHKSRYSQAADEVGSTRSKRESLKGVPLAAQASPLYLARNRPVVQRKVTVAHLEYYVPAEFANPRAFELLVDELLARASEFEASVHTLVGDIAVVSWNATKSVNMAEYLACQFSAEMCQFVRRKFPKQAFDGGKESAPYNFGRVRGPNMECSASATHNHRPRITGAIMTGEARLCFAGSKNYEFCMSYPQWQPVLVELRRLAAGRNMVCLDATTRSGAGGRIRARAVDALTVYRRTYGSFSRAALDRSHMENSVFDHGASTLPLVELAKSPHVRQFGDSHVNQPPAAANSSLQNNDADDCFDFIVYEMTSVVKDDSGNSSSSKPFSVSASPYKNNLGASGTLLQTTGSVVIPSPARGIDIGADDDPLGMAIGLGTSGSMSPTAPRLSFKPKLSGTGAPDDPDDLITKGVHLAGIDRRYNDASRRFKEAMDILAKQMALAGNRASARVAEQPSDNLLTLPGHQDLGCMFRPQHSTSGDYRGRADDDTDDADEPALADPNNVSSVTVEQLHGLAGELFARACRCADTSARTFGSAIVTTQGI